MELLQGASLFASPDDLPELHVAVAREADMLRSMADVVMAFAAGEKVRAPLTIIISRGTALLSESRAHMGVGLARKLVGHVVVSLGRCADMREASSETPAESVSRDGLSRLVWKGQG